MEKKIIDIDSMREQEEQTFIRFEGKDYPLLPVLVDDISKFDSTRTADIETLREMATILLGPNASVLFKLRLPELRVVMQAAVKLSGIDEEKNDTPGAG